SALAEGPLGAMWAVVGAQAQVWLISDVMENQVEASGGASTDSFAAQCRGFGWITEPDADLVLRVYATASIISKTSLPLAASSHPTGIACAPDGSVWFALAFANKIARFKNDGADTYEEFPIADGAYPYAIAIGSDGSVWFSEVFGRKI